MTSINTNKNTISQQYELWEGTQFDWGEDNEDNITLPKATEIPI